MGDKNIVWLWLGKFDWRYLNWPMILLGFQSDKQGRIVDFTFTEVVKVKNNAHNLHQHIPADSFNKSVKELDSNFELVEKAIWSISATFEGGERKVELLTTKSLETAEHVVAALKTYVRNTL